jgi:hypothetical protein
MFGVIRYYYIFRLPTPAIIRQGIGTQEEKVGEVSPYEQWVKSYYKRIIIIM